MNTKEYSYVMDILPRLMYALFSDYKTMDDGLKKTQLRALLSIESRKEMPMGDISMHLNLEKGSVTTLVNQMVEKGLLERSKHQDDGRIVMVRLTELGRKTVQKHKDDMDAYLKERMSLLNPKEQKAMMNAFSVLDDSALKLMKRDQKS
jgi:DNA-binding MarR family transcriptional regulator